MSEGGFDNANQPKETGPINTLEAYIGLGLDAIREENYKDAISQFSNPKAAASLGFRYNTDRKILILTRPPKDGAEAGNISILYTTNFGLMHLQKMAQYQELQLQP